MSNAEKRSHEKQRMNYEQQDSIHDDMNSPTNSPVHCEQRAVESLPRQMMQPPTLSLQASHLRRHVEFVYPKNDSVHAGEAFHFHKQIQRGDFQDTEAKKGEKLNGNSKQTDKLVLALLRLGDDDSKTTESGSFNSKENGKSEGRHLSGLSVEDAVRDKAGCRPRANSTDGELNLPQRGLCDERAVLESHRWTIYGGDRKERPPRGFQNLGNTCFLNSTLQCLAYLPPFCQSLLAMQSSSSPLSMSSQFASQSIKKDASSPGKRITWMLRSLFQQIHVAKENNASSISHALAPRAIVNALPSIGTCGSRHGYKFRLGRQEDAHEFLVHLLDAMQDGELRAAGINQHVSGWRDRLPVPRLDETTFVHRIFGGYLRSQVQCTTCGYVSNTYDPFLDLALEVSRQSSTSIGAALAEFTKKETLDSQNRWKCSGCHKHVCATKQLTVFRPPLALCIQLKRFSFGSYGGDNTFAGGMWSRGGRVSGNKIFNHNVFGRGGSKITKPIEFPSDLNLPLSDGRNCAYSLTGVVIHVGGSASSGHYTAYVTKPVASGGFQWFHMDDSFVEQVSEKQVLRQKDAYVLFYCRKEVKLEFPAPPKVSMSTAEAKQLAKVRAMAASRLPDDIQPESSKVPHNSNKIAVSPSLESLTSNLSTKKTSPSPTDGSYCSSTLSHPTLKVRLDPPGKTLEPDSATSEESDIESVEGIESQLIKSSECASMTTVKSDLSWNTTDSHKSKIMSATTAKSVLSGRLGHGDSLSFELAEAQRPEASDQLPTGKAKYSVLESTARQAERNLTNSSDDISSSGDSSSDDSSSDDSSSDDSSSSSDIDDCSSSESSRVVANSKPAVIADRKGSQSSNEHSRPPSVATEALVQKKDGGMLAKLAASNTSTTSTSDDTSTADSKNEKSKQIPSESSREPNSIQGKDGIGRTRVVLDRGGAHGKLEVLLGQRSSKSTGWKTTVQKHDKEHELLGNRAVGRWDDDDGDDDNKQSSDDVKANSSDHRAQIVRRMDDSERSRKRKMHLDRWDAHLDQGKQKKIKAKQSGDHNDGFSDPKKNVFQRIQSGLQRMNKGRAKGLFHLKKKHPPPQRHGKSKHRPPR